MYFSILRQQKIELADIISILIAEIFWPNFTEERERDYLSKKDIKKELFI